MLVAQTLPLINQMTRTTFNFERTVIYANARAHSPKRRAPDPTTPIGPDPVLFSGEQRADKPFFGDVCISVIDAKC